MPEVDTPAPVASAAADGREEPEPTDEPEPSIDFSSLMEKAGCYFQAMSVHRRPHNGEVHHYIT
jgi:hypothetical protein